MSAPEGAVLQVDAQIRRGSFAETIGVRADPGSVLAVLGPNGSGKSTLLRAVAGLLPVAAGSIVLGGRVLDDASSGTFVPAYERPVGLVFQDYRLFPHLSVCDNVAFAPRARGMGRRDSRAIARDWLDRLDLTETAGRRPGDISGGQAQRVALARALATEPKLLLLDEPLAALDARTRLEVQSQLRRHLADFAGPVLLVTHDPLEALVLADRLVVIEAGRIVQEGAPADIARRPATDYVARLVGLNLWAGLGSGSSVALDGGGAITVPGAAVSGAAVSGAAVSGAAVFRATVPDAAPPGRVLIAVRPSSISVHRTAPEGASARNVWAGRVTGLSLLTDRVRLSIDGAPAALVDVTPAAVAELDLAPGSRVWLSLKATELEVYPAL